MRLTTFFILCLLLMLTCAAGVGFAQDVDRVDPSFLSNASSKALITHLQRRPHDVRPFASRGRIRPHDCTEPHGQPVNRCFALRQRSFETNQAEAALAAGRERLDSHAWRISSRRPRTYFLASSKLL
jgi:hypothetical protein